MDWKVNGVKANSPLYKVSRKEKLSVKKDTKFKKEISLLLKRVYKDDTDNFNSRIADNRQHKKRKCEKETSKYEEGISNLFTCLNIYGTEENDNNSVKNLHQFDTFFTNFIVHRKASGLFSKYYINDMRNKGFYISEVGKISHKSSLKNRLTEDEPYTQTYLTKGKVNQEKYDIIEKYSFEIRTELVVSSLMSTDENIWMNEVVDVVYSLVQEDSGLRQIKACVITPKKQNVTDVQYIIDTNQYGQERSLNVLKENILEDLHLKNLLSEKVIFCDANLAFTNLNVYNIYRILQSTMEFAKTEYSLYKRHQNCDEFEYEGDLVICEESENETLLVKHSCNKANLNYTIDETFDARFNRDQNVTFDVFEFEGDLVICEEPVKEIILENQPCSETDFNKMTDKIDANANSKINNTIIDLFMLEIRIKQCRDILKKFGEASSSYNSFKKLKLKSAKLIKTYKILMNKKRQKESRKLKAMKRACIRGSDVLPQNTLSSNNFSNLNRKTKSDEVDKENVLSHKKRVSRKSKKHTDDTKYVPGRSKLLDECIMRVETSKNISKFRNKSKYPVENKILHWQNENGAKEFENNELDSERRGAPNDPFDKEIDKILSQLPSIEDLPNLSESSDKKYISVGINESLDFDIGNGEEPFVIFPYITP